ncbi:response regulator [Marinilabiliaceae bacterium JC017]|nr:response regulator [Marinilabiliaceae bacterium JC017]
MKKAIIIGCVSIVLVVLANVYYYLDTYSWQINTQKNILLKQSLICRDQLDQYFQKTQTNILLLLSNKELDSLFTQRGRSIEVQKRLELLFARYSEHLTELKVTDKSGNTYGLRKSNNAAFVSYFSKSPPIEELVAKIYIDPKGESINYIQPVMEDYEIYGYVQFNINLKDFFNSAFYNFNLKDVHFQWIVKPSGWVLYNTLGVDSFYPELIHLNNLSEKKSSFSHIHNLFVGNDKLKVLSVFQKLNFHGSKYYVVFSLPVKLVTSSIVENAFILGLISLFVILLIILWFGYYMKRKNVEGQRLQQTQDALRKMLYYLPVGIVLTDGRNQIVQVNKAAINMFSYDDEDQLLGQVATDDVLFENRVTLERARYSESSNKYVLKNSKGDETVILSEAIPFFLQSEKYIIDVFIEITPLELERRSAQSANKAKSTFIANISHELRTPLNGIIGLTDVLLTSPLPEQERDMLQVVKRSADTLLILINDILDFSKIEAGKFEIESIEFDLHDEIERTIKSFYSFARDKNIQLSWYSAVLLPKDFISDPIRLRQVLNNLISNAIKFTPGGGRIYIGITSDQAINGNPVLRFSIKDTGIGIKQDKLKAIFNPFSQEDESITRKYGGTGLGTTISRQLINLLGGEIEVHSPSGLSTQDEYPGAEFIFTLPLKTNRQVKQVDFSHITHFKQLKTLVVSDDPLQVQSITKNLMSLHIDYAVLPPSTETLDILRTRSKYQLLIIDHRIDFDGLTFLHDLHNRRLDTNYMVIIQSSDLQPANTKIAKQFGADVYLRKPIKLYVLQTFLHKQLPKVMNHGMHRLLALPENLKVLVAEDNRLNQRVAQSLFQKMGVVIDLANDGSDAVSKVKGTQYDIIFMDLSMPGMDDFSAAKSIKEVGSRCPLIAMTVSNDIHEKERVLDTKIIDDYMVKPTRQEDISRMLTKWCMQD